MSPSSNRKHKAILLAAALIGVAGLFIYGPLREPEPVPIEHAVAPVFQEKPPAENFPKVSFTDISEQAGINFTHVNGAYGDRLLPETMGAGACFFDYDNDQDADLLLVNSNYWPGHQAPDTAAPTLKLYVNDGNGMFSDLTVAAGLDISLYGMGCASGDIDNDGWADLFITAVGANLLLRNNHGRFQDISADAGVAGASDAWSSGAAFFDMDNDGDLDLFVANYIKWSREIDVAINFQLTGVGRAYGPPTAFEGSFPYLYRNDGAGHFSDISRSAGVQVRHPATQVAMAKALAVHPFDYDKDGLLDLLIANDTVRNFLFHNRGDGLFEEVGTEMGVAFDRNGQATGAMGVDAADYRGDGSLGVIIGNFANEMSSLYVTPGGEVPFTDDAIIEGIGAPSRRALSFATLFFDYDLDGRLDLLQVNGHIENEINRVQSSQQYAQPAQLFWNTGGSGGAVYRQVPLERLGDLARPLVGRGAAYADIDGDGDLDLLLTQAGRRALLLRNDTPGDNHWLRVRLTGSRSNRDAIGARVELRAGGRTLRRELMPTRGYLSQVEKTLTFGLGKLDKIDGLTVYWPDGSRRSVEHMAVDTTLAISQEHAPAGSVP